jgi:enamine deaminase RidA (YjgF/YER057c/UK114 family)
MDTISLLSPDGLVASPAFSHVAVVPASATTVYVGGQNAVDATGALVGADDPGAQTRQVMANLVTALDAAGSSLTDVVSMTVLLVDGVDVTSAYAAAAESLAGLAVPPLVTAAVVSGLGVPGALVEVGAVAAVLP